jgi:tetratricopeptide (TPR) repeat protein
MRVLALLLCQVLFLGSTSCAPQAATDMPTACDEALLVPEGASDTPISSTACTEALLRSDDRTLADFARRYVSGSPNTLSRSDISALADKSKGNAKHLFSALEVANSPKDPGSRNLVRGLLEVARREDDSLVEAASFWALAKIKYANEDFRSAQDHFEEALRTAEANNFGGFANQIRADMTDAYKENGEWEAISEISRQAFLSGNQINSSALIKICMSLRFIGTSLTRVSDAELLDRIEAARAAEEDDVADCISFAFVPRSLRRGDFDRAEVTAQNLLDRSSDTKIEPMRPLFIHALGQVAFYRGDFVEALEKYEEVIPLFEQAGEVYYQYSTMISVDVNACAFIEDLAAHVQSAMAPDGVSIDVDCEKVRLSPDTANSLGLMICEMLINACKHAFPFIMAARAKPGQTFGDDRNVILVEIWAEGGTLTARVLDNGVGLAKETNSRRGTGSQLIQDLARQIGARAVFGQTEEGSCWTVEGIPGTKVQSSETRSSG